MSELKLQTSNTSLTPIEDRPGVGGTQFNLILREEWISQNRRMGNTTRLIDSIIQLLFTTDTIILVRDHYQNGADRRANEFLFDRVLKRLASEHHITFVGVKDRDDLLSSTWTEVIVNKSRLTIQRIR